MPRRLGLQVRDFVDQAPMRFEVPFAAIAPKPIPKVPEMRQPMTVPRRDGDMLRADTDYNPWASPWGLGGLILNGWFGPSIRKAGQYWPTKDRVQELEAYLDMVPEKNDPSAVYPRYYLNGFHGYTSNFSAESAAQQASAMAGIPALMTNTPLNEAWALRRSKLQAFLDTVKAHQGPAARRTRLVVDLGCGTGTTTRMLASVYDKATVVGVDLSPRYLRMAEALNNPPEGMHTPEELQQLWLGQDVTKMRDRIVWSHGNIEGTRLKPGTADLVTLHFTAHELPTMAMEGTAQEALRLLKPGGWFAMIENDQNVSNLHRGAGFKRFAAGLMSFEPHVRQYLFEDLEKIFKEAGFHGVEDTGTVKGCTVVVAQKPPYNSGHTRPAQ